MQLCPGLFGGGGDGGATGAESRDSYLQMYKTKQAGQLDAREEALARWTCCRLTRLPLGGDDGRRPVACCQLGYLYDREAVLQCLAEAATGGAAVPAAAAHVTSLRDLCTLRLKLADVVAAESRVGSAADFRASEGCRFACPVTGVPLNGHFRFVVLRPHGLVVSEKALRSAPDAVAELITAQGGAPQKGPQQPPLPINGTAEEVEALRTADEATKAAKHGKRKAKPPGEHKPVAVVQEKAEAKRFKAAEHAPAGATPAVYASLFRSGNACVPETYGARALSFRRG